LNALISQRIWAENAFRSKLVYGICEVWRDLVLIICEEEGVCGVALAVRIWNCVSNGQYRLDVNILCRGLGYLTGRAPVWKAIFGLVRGGGLKGWLGLVTIELLLALWFLLGGRWRRHRIIEEDISGGTVIKEEGLGDSVHKMDEGIPF